MKLHSRRLLLISALLLTGIWTGSAQAENNQTWTDPQTGLEWTRCEFGQTYADSPYSQCTGDFKSFSWANAILTASTANLLGHQDWRVPTVQEMSTVFRCARSSIISAAPTVDAADIENCGNGEFDRIIFPAAAQDGYWTSTPGRDVSKAWCVFKNMNQFFDDQYCTASAIYLVRGGTPDGVFHAQIPVAQAMKAAHDAVIKKAKDEEAAVKQAAEQKAQVAQRLQAQRVANAPAFRKQLRAGARALVFHRGNWARVSVLQIKGNFVQIRSPGGDQWVSLNEMYPE